MEIFPLNKKAWIAPAEGEAEPKETAELRYAGTVPLEKFMGSTIGVAGLGATGKQVVEILAVMGHKQMWGSDPDTIELKNVGTQGWSPKLVGQHKAQALSDIVELGQRGRSTFTGYVSKFEDLPLGRSTNPRMPIDATSVFFCCVDTMSARLDIWNELRRQGLLQGPKIWIESRIASRIIRIITIDLNDGAMKKYYETTLYSDESAFAGSCTDRMTYYSAGIAAGLMVSQLVNWLNYNCVASVDFMLETAGMGMTRIK